MQIVKFKFRLFIIFFGSVVFGTVNTSLSADNSSTYSLVGPEKAKQKSCQLWPEVLLNMPVGNAMFTSASGKRINFQYRLANTSERMQHGFQHTCAQTIATTKMLFQFERVNLPTFHMNNVVAPLDIAFIDETGKIIDIFLMKIYGILEVQKPLYSPSKPVLYALETRAGYFAELGVKVGDSVSISIK